MKVLFDIGHPGHVHLFRHCARALIDAGHQVFITIRERDIVGQLLEAHGFEYHIASKAKTGVVGLFIELIEHDWQVLRLTRQHNIDLLVGTSVAVSHVSRLTRARSIVFNEDDADVVKLFAWLAYPFADTVAVPDCVRDRRRANYVTYNSYHELAYLHPNHFQPDPTVRQELGLNDNEPFFIMRMVALKAYHDVGQAGLSQAAKERILEMLLAHGRVFITVEGDLPAVFQPYQIRIPPHRIHHALALSTLLISDSQTMTAEAAVLGVPAIRCNTFVGRLAYLEELEQRYDLTYGFLPMQESAMLTKLESLLAMPDLRKVWQTRRQAMLNDKTDAAAWMLDFLTTYPLHPAPLHRKAQP